MFEAWLQDTRFALRLLRKEPALYHHRRPLTRDRHRREHHNLFGGKRAVATTPAGPCRAESPGRSRTNDPWRRLRHRLPSVLPIRARARDDLADVYGYRLEPTPMSLGGGDAAERVYGTVVSGNYFTVLGTRAVHGRTLEDRDDGPPGANPVTVISYELWERRFESNPAIVGRSILLNSHPFTVVGIAPRGFQGTTLLRSDLWLPISMTAEAIPRHPARLESRQAVWLVMGGRLKDGVSIPQAQSEMHAIAAGLEREFPEDYRERGIVVAGSALVPGRISMVAAFMGLLMTIVGLVLLIACVNVAGMMLARAAARRREIAVRLAIGAGRGRLVRQLMTEAVVVFSAGGAIGLILSVWLTSLLLQSAAGAAIPRRPRDSDRLARADICDGSLIRHRAAVGSGSGAAGVGPRSRARTQDRGPRFGIVQTATAQRLRRRTDHDVAAPGHRRRPLPARAAARGQRPTRLRSGARRRRDDGSVDRRLQRRGREACSFATCCSAFPRCPASNQRPPLSICRSTADAWVWAQ